MLNLNASIIILRGTAHVLTEIHGCIVEADELPFEAFLALIADVGVGRRRAWYTQYKLTWLLVKISGILIKYILKKMKRFDL